MSDALIARVRYLGARHRTHTTGRHRAMHAVVGLAAATALIHAAPSRTAAQEAPRSPATWRVPTDAYVPPVNGWERRRPAAVGIDSAALADAIAFAIANDASAPRDQLEMQLRSFGREPYGDPIGPLKPRGEPTGIVLRHGYLVAEWGDPDRVDMTHSVTKSLLSSVVGVAFDRGLIPDLDAPVAARMAPVRPLDPAPRSGLAADWPREGDFLVPFSSPHNARITWDHLLRQTSDWEGTLWGKPEWADRPDRDATTWRTRERKAPGSAWEYNDTRVNVLALAATNVWRRPLPQVLRESVMDPIGASPSWRWYGYDDAWIVLDGQPVQVPSGGGHWGAGLFINAWDMARFGLLTLRRGRWGDRQLLSEAWVTRALTPTAPNPTYGYMNWFLNTDRRWIPSATPQSFGHVGNGTNVVLCVPELDLVVVVRWIENRALDGFVERLLARVAAD